MSRIAQAFIDAHEQGRAAVITYAMVGDPDVNTTIRIVKSLVEGGADIIELGVPFSDPLADGATIQRAAERALANGVSLYQCLTAARMLRHHNVTAPIVLMGYYNPFHHYGLPKFAAEAAAAGVDGVIIPDLPPEEAGDLQAALQQHSLDLIFLLAPTSTNERIAKVAQLASGFIYCVSLTGVTGARAEFSTAVGGLIARVRELTSLPLAIGFGISTPAHASQAAQLADGVVVASALIDRLDRLPAAERPASAREFATELRAAARK